MFLAVCLMVTVSLTIAAQGTKITGTLIDRDTKKGVMLATVQMLKPDSTYVSGVLSDEKGRFSIEASAAGSYILKISSVGYTPLTKTIKVDGKRILHLVK